MTSLNYLDLFAAILGLIYLWLEFRASVWLWLVGVIMPAIDMVLYFKAGLYADAGMAVYYCLAAAYGVVMWKWGAKGKAESKTELPISRFPKRLVVPAALCFLLAWGALYLILRYLTDSTVPILDSFVNALSFVALWALARKYCEQWLIWLVVDAICTGLYAYKGIPFKAGLYGIYTVIAWFGYLKWKRQCEARSAINN